MSLSKVGLLQETDDTIDLLVGRVPSPSVSPQARYQFLHFPSPERRQILDGQQRAEDLRRLRRRCYRDPRLGDQQEANYR